MEKILLKACRREKTYRTPIWLMRQAGRFMPGYQEIRKKVGFLELCKNPDLAAQVTVLAVEKLGVDAAIIFSDILVIVEALGFQLTFAKDHGPVIGNPFRRKEDLKKISGKDVNSKLGFVFDAIRLARRNLKTEIPLIGFAGAPFTVASYLIEGGKSTDFSLTKKMMTDSPENWDHLMNTLGEATAEYLKSQIEAGAEALQLFDTWAGVLSLEQYRKYVLPHLKKIISGVDKKVPVIYFGLNTFPLFPGIMELGVDVVSVDSNTSLTNAWEILGDVALQGNFDPRILLTDEKRIKAEAKRILSEVNGRPGHIFNLGHGVLPQTPVGNVRFLVDFVKEESA